MTRKDFELIARVLKDSRPAAKELNDDNVKEAARQHAKNAQVDFVSIAFAVELAKQNPRFDKDKFYTACGTSR